MRAQRLGPGATAGREAPSGTTGRQPGRPSAALCGGETGRPPVWTTEPCRGASGRVPPGQGTRDLGLECGVAVPV